MKRESKDCTKFISHERNVRHERFLFTLSCCLKVFSSTICCTFPVISTEFWMFICFPIWFVYCRDRLNYPSSPPLILIVRAFLRLCEDSTEGKCQPFPSPNTATSWRDQRCNAVAASLLNTPQTPGRKGPGTQRTGESAQLKGINRRTGRSFCSNTPFTQTLN